MKSQKLESIETYNGKKENVDARIMGSAIGMTLKCGTAEELSQKLKILEKYNTEKTNADMRIIGHVI